MYSELFEQFVKERIYLKGVTKKTVIFYRNSWASFEKHHTGELSKQSLTDYVTAMRQSGIKPVSCNTYISCINAFLRWLHQRNITPNYLKSVSSKSREKSLGRSASRSFA